MIWLVLVAVVFVVGGAWFVSRSMMVRGIVLTAGLAAVAGYWMVGRPGMQDEPLARRLAGIDRHWNEKGPEGLTDDEILAYIEMEVRRHPDRPGPHLALGTMLEIKGRPQEALVSYESALRRDPNEIEAIKRLADLRFKMTGEVDEATSALYHEWFRREPNELRVGYLAGIGDWVAGRKDEAEKIWADVEARTPEGDPRRGMFKALREMFGVDPAPTTPAPQPG